MDANKIQVTDEDGNDLEFDVLFTFNSDETGKKYVLYYDASEEAPQVFSSIYDDEGNLFPIETPEEWDMIEEVFSSFIAEDDEEDEDGCCQEDGHVCCHGENKGDEHVCCHGENKDDEHVCCQGEDHDDQDCCCKNEG